MSHVFISYSHDDNWEMRTVRAELEKVGLPVWTDGGIDPGTPSWQRAIEQAINASYCVLVLCSPNSISSRWVEAEITYAVKSNKGLIPVILKGEISDVVPITLVTSQVSDLRDGSFESGIAKLVTEIRNRLKKAGFDGWRVPLRVDKDADIFIHGIEYLEKHNCNQLMIYAPTGVWNVDKWKKRWFWTVAYCLANAERDPNKRAALHGNLETIATNQQLGVTPPSTTLRNFIGVYGLPPRRPKSEFAKQLDVMEEGLLVFDQLDNAHLHFMRTESNTIPGTGAILIDTSILFLGFAVEGRYQVDYGFFVTEPSEIPDQVKNWFHNHVMSIVSRNYIQNMGKKRSVKDGMSSIRKQYKTP